MADHTPEEPLIGGPLWTRQAAVELIGLVVGVDGLLAAHVRHRVQQRFQADAAVADHLVDLEVPREVGESRKVVRVGRAEEPQTIDIPQVRIIATCGSDRRQRVTDDGECKPAARHVTGCAGGGEAGAGAEALGIDRSRPGVVS
ncbi:hypothetical protein [Umezawaea beigongshangensis]|uniref:hypothetical protein n=1 Tax=Umezawaea beigongshangensis TaxID=2780383 RepID=UPI0018F12DCA|nr:hypothetical protein [Umezawaea beigongshangensis]